MFKVGKTYAMKSGHEVTITLAGPERSRYPIVGRLRDGSVVTFTSEGKFFNSNKPSYADLIPEEKDDD